MTRTIVAIDGPAGSGKSSVSRAVASKLGLTYVDTGATYRIVALQALRRGIALDDADGLAALAAEVMPRCRIVDGGVLHFDGRPVGGEIRTPEVSEATSIISTHPAVRSVLVDFQRRLVPVEGAVVEGRDIGAVVWPSADVKVYLDARPDVRASRRAAEQGSSAAVATEVHERDLRDASRPVSAMQPAPGAIRIDTSDMTAEQVAGRVLDLLTATAHPDHADLFFTSVRGVLRGLLRGLFRMEITGAENVPRLGAAIVAPNHRSLVDIPVACMPTTRKVWFMAKEELFGSKTGATLLRNLGAFPVRRGKPDRTALMRALQILDQGRLLGIFPEGTRTPGARFHRLEEGFAYVALKSGAPIVPIAISGTEAIFPPDSKLPRPAKIRVHVGEQFTLGGPYAGVLPRARIRDATAVAQQRLVAVMNELEPR
jgi:cytidylate kinase